MEGSAAAPDPDIANKFVTALDNEDFAGAANILRALRCTANATHETEGQLISELFSPARYGSGRQIEGQEPPAGQDTVIKFANALIEAGDFGSAISMLQKAESHYRGHHLIRLSLIRARHLLGDTQYAKIEADSFQKQLSKNDPALRLLYYLYLDLGALDSAASVSKSILNGNPEDTSVRRSRIGVLLKSNRRDEAIQDIALLIKSKSATADDYHFAARNSLNINTTSTVQLACDAAQCAIAAGFKPPFVAQVTHVQALIRARKRRLARRRLNDLNASAKTVREFAEVAELWLTLGHPKNAITAAKRGLSEDKLSQEPPFTQVRLADVFSSCGNQQDAIRVLQNIDWRLIKDTSALKRFYVSCQKAQVLRSALESGGRLLEINPLDLKLRDEVTFLELSCRVAAAPSRSTSTHRGFLALLMRRKD
jgi:tetratricopeptide (TPR) repeat protein